MDDFSFLYHLCRLNVSRFVRTEKQAEIYGLGPYKPSIMAKFSLTLLRDSVLSNKRGGAGIIQDEQGMHFFYLTKGAGLYFLGPFITDNESPLFLKRQFSHRNRMPVLTQDELNTYLHVLNLFSRDHSDFLSEKIEMVNVHNPVFDLYHEQSFEDIETQYVHEKNIRNAIASGDRTGLVHLFLQGGRSRNFSYRLPQNPLRGQKNISIVLNTIGRHSAEKGGLPTHLLHSISEDYALKIEGCRSEEELLKINRSMLLDYCDAVHNYGIGRYSGAIVRVSRYILENLNRPLSLKELAPVGGISESYLSRLFHEETGKTLSAYIREKKITEARWLLVNGDSSITQIALELGFEDVNYFSRCFSGETGMSPREYRRLQGQGTSQMDFDGLPG